MGGGGGERGLKHCEFHPRQVRSCTSFFSFSISGWLSTATCLSMCCGMGVGEGDSHWEPYGVRLGSSITGLCKLFDGAGTSTSEVGLLC